MITEIPGVLFLGVPGLVVISPGQRSAEGETGVAILPVSDILAARAHLFAAQSQMSADSGREAEFELHDFRWFKRAESAAQIRSGEWLNNTAVIVIAGLQRSTMQLYTANLALLATSLLVACGRQEPPPDVNPMLGRACFENRLPSLPPGSQYEGIQGINGNRLTIKVMDGVKVSSVECGLAPDGTLEK